LRNPDIKLDFPPTFCDTNPKLDKHHHKFISTHPNTTECLNNTKTSLMFSLTSFLRR